MVFREKIKGRIIWIKIKVPTIISVITDTGDDQRN